MISCLLNAFHAARHIKKYQPLPNIFIHFIPLCRQWEKTVLSHLIHSLWDKNQCGVKISCCSSNFHERSASVIKDEKENFGGSCSFPNSYLEKKQYRHDFLITAIGVQNLILLHDNFTLLPVSEGMNGCEAKLLAKPGNCSYRIYRKSSCLSQGAEDRRLTVNYVACLSSPGMAGF